MLKREKTEHNVIKVACTEHFDWLVIFPEMEINWPLTTVILPYIIYNKSLRFRIVQCFNPNP